MLLLLPQPIVEKSVVRVIVFNMVDAAVATTGRRQMVIPVDKNEWFVDEDDHRDGTWSSLSLSSLVSSIRRISSRAVGCDGGVNSIVLSVAVAVAAVDAMASPKSLCTVL
jgi:hypothetical protein